MVFLESNLRSLGRHLRLIKHLVISLVRTLSTISCMDHGLKNPHVTRFELHVMFMSYITLTCGRPSFDDFNSLSRTGRNTPSVLEPEMPLAEGETFLPRIHSVFYAIFDVKTGPKIVFQVPEGLIAPVAPAASLSVTSSPKPSSATLAEGEEQKLSRRSSSSLVSAGGQRPGSLRHLPSPQHRSTSSGRTLFNFNDISKYVIPPNPLCGRLVVCATGNYRIIGLPVSLAGKYERYFFRFNLCFVFERSANLSCYEPIVRKVSRVLTACEVRPCGSFPIIYAHSLASQEESMFLSNPQTSLAMYTIIEQLYEDLNSYSETSIPIDDFNSIELKIFPFYPNPPSVNDWHVPLALINLSKRIEDNWDLTMRKVDLLCLDSKLF